MRSLLLVFCFAAAAMSCSKSEDVGDQNSSPDEEFFALKVGNSWVYKNYLYDIASDSYLESTVVDSVSITAAEEISGETYYVFRRNTIGNEDGLTVCNPNGEYFERLRAQDGQLVNENGDVKFTYTDYSERVVQSEDWGTVYEAFQDEDSSLTVEAGEFECVFSERYVKTTQGDQFPATDRFFYASGTGLIYDTSSYASSDKPAVIRRLYSYSVQ